MFVFNNQIVDPPNNVDWVAIDPYFNPTSPACNADQRGQYNIQVNPLLNWIRGFDKPIILIGQAFKHTIMPSPCQMEWYYDTATEADDIIGLLWFAYGYTHNRMNMVGYPEQYEKHKELGKEILNCIECE